MRSAKALQGAQTWLKAMADDPANWERVAVATRDLAFTERQVIARLKGVAGNVEAENKLVGQWHGLWQRAGNLLITEKPKLFGRALAYVGRFLKDFWAGARAAYQGYVDWLITQAKPVLRKHHAAVVQLRRLKAQQRAGRLKGQGANMAKADAMLTSIRGIYATVSAGGDIDKLAIEEHGAYPALGAIQFAALPITVIIGLVLILGLVIALTVLLAKMAGGIGAAGWAGLGVAAIFGLALLVGRLRG